MVDGLWGDLKSGRWLIPILMVGIVGLNIYDSFVDPDGAWFYWISALFYAVIALKGEATTETAAGPGTRVSARRPPRRSSQSRLVTAQQESPHG
jgi:hypothetical protein